MPKLPKTGKRILLIEDDDDIRDVLINLLEGEGYCVTGAESGLSGLHVLMESAPPDLILLDLMMEEMNGVQFRKEQKRLEPRLAGIPVVVFSADNKAVQTAGEMQAAGCLRKPADLNLLLSTIQQYC